MPPLEKPGYETYARSRAQNIPIRDAYRGAGFSANHHNYGRLEKIPEVVARVAELRCEMLWGGSPDVAPVINHLMKLAGEAAKLGSAPGFAAARGLLAEAGRLKAQIPNRDDLVDMTPPEPPMSREEWLATYGAKR